VETQKHTASDHYTANPPIALLSVPNVTQHQWPASAPISLLLPDTRHTHKTIKQNICSEIATKLIKVLKL